MAGTYQQIVGLFSMSRGIDAHQYTCVWIVGEKGVEIGPRLAFLALRDSIFEIDDDRISAARKGLGDTLRAGCGDEQRTADDS